MANKEKYLTTILCILAFLCILPLHAQKAKPKPIDGIGGYNLGSVYFTKEKKKSDRNIYRVQAKQKKDLFDELMIETDQKGVIYRIFASVPCQSSEADRLFEQTVRDLKAKYNVKESEEESTATLYCFFRDGRMIHVGKRTDRGPATSYISRIGAKGWQGVTIEFKIRDRKPEEKPVKKIF